MQIRKRIKAVTPIWLTIYSDLMTNLTLFFLMLFTTQLLTISQRQAAFDSVKEVFSSEGETKKKRLGEKEGAGDFAKKWVKLDTKLESIKDAKLIKIQLPSDILFSLGKAELKKKAFFMLDKYALLFEEHYGKILVEGHTDDIPIVKGSRYKTNWELSTARAYTVLKYLEDNHNVEPSNIFSVGYSHYHPLYPNDTPENRAKNRRVEIKFIQD